MEETRELSVWVELLISVSIALVVNGLIFLPAKLRAFFKKEMAQEQVALNATGHVKPNLTILMIGILSVGLFGFMEILSIVVRNGTDTWWTHAMFTLMVCAGIYLIAAYFRVWFEYGETGVNYQTTRGIKGRLSWLDVSHVGFSAMMQRLTFENRTGDKMRVPVTYINGIQEFADLVLLKVNPNAFNENARLALEQLAAGESPFERKGKSGRPPLARFFAWLTHRLRKVVANCRSR